MTLETYTKALLKFRWTVIVLSLLIVVICVAGATRLTFSSDYQVFFGKDNPELAAFENTQDVYSRSDNILIMLAPDKGEVFSVETLQAVLELTEKAWKLPYVTRVDSIANFQHTYGQGDELVIESMYTNTDIDLSELKQTVLAEPLLVNRLISADAQATAVNITFNPPNVNPLSETPEIVNATKALLADIGKRYPEIKIYETGVVLLNYTLAELTIKDMTTLVPLIYVLVAVGVALFLKSAWLSMATVVLVTLSIGAAMGLAGWAGIVLSPPSASVPPIIMTLAVADCLHLLATLQQRRSAGSGLHEAIVESVKLNFSPILLTSLSTAIGFMTLNFSDAPPFRDLGNITAMGVLIAFVLSVTFMPAFLTFMPQKKALVGPGFIAPKMQALATSVIRFRKPLLLFGMLCIGLGLLFLPKNELNDNFVEYVGEQIKFRTDTDTMTNKLVGLYTVEYSLDSGVSSGVTDPQFMSQVDAFAAWLQTQPSVVHVDSMTEIIKKLHFNLHEDNPDYYALPENAEQIAQYLLLYEMSLPNGLDLNSQLNIDKSSTRIVISLKTMSTSQMLEFERNATAWLETNAPGIEAVGVSPSLMFSHISIRNINSMLIGTVVALLLISVALIVPLGSVKFGLITVVSNLAPAVIAFGIWGLTIGKVSLGVSVVIAMTLGIVVDDTIHLVSKYLHARRKLGLEPESAIKFTFSTVGVALVGTTVILALGFLVMAFSAYQVNSHMGLLSAVTICIALLIDLIVIPPLLLFAEKGDPQPSKV